MPLQLVGSLEVCQRAAADTMNPKLSSLVNRGVYSCCGGGGGGGGHKTGTKRGEHLNCLKIKSPSIFRKGPTVEIISFCTK